MTQSKQERFCRCYLTTMDPDRAAGAVGEASGEQMLRRKGVQRTLERMRRTGGDVRREDVVRRLTALAFGRANDAVKLACQGGEAEGIDIARMELSAVSEFRRNSAGAVEVKFIDRVRALEALNLLLGSDGTAVEQLFRALGDGEDEDE